jgi:hypothetical protein
MPLVLSLFVNPNCPGNPLKLEKLSEFQCCAQQNIKADPIAEETVPISRKSLKEARFIYICHMFYVHKNGGAEVAQSV